MEGNTGENGRYNNSKNNGESSRQTTERGHSNRGRGGGRMGGLGSPADNNRPPPLLPSYNHNQQDRRNSQENGWPGNRGNFRQGPDRNQGQGGRYQQNLNYYNNTGRNMNAGRGGGNFSNYNNHQNQRMQYMQQQQHSPHYNNNGNDYRQQGNWREDGGGRHEIAVKYYEPDLLKLLEEEGIYQLRRKSLRFQKANFFCRLCEYHCEEPENCVQHIKNSRHQKLATVREFDQYLGSLPLPSTVMEEAVGDAVLRISELHSITQQELEQRKLAVQELADRLHRLVPEAELEMTGSTYSGLALKTSDVNIHLCINDSVSIVKCIMAVKEIIETSEDYTDMSNDLRCTFPSLSYTATKYGNCRVVVGIGNTSIRAMTRLMAAFVNIDKRFAVLARAFHYWAKLCNVADQKTGSLPTIAFTVMVANFLQQTAEPVLPTLRELCPSGKPENFPLPADVRTTFVQENTQSIGQLWLQMLHYYGREFKFAAFNINVTQSRPSARVDKAYSKKMSVEDPFNPKRNLTRRVSNTAVLEFIMDRLFKILCRYFSVPQLSFGQLFYTLTVDQMLFKEKRTTNSSLDTEDESDKDTSSDLDMALERLSIRKNSLSFDSDIDEHTRSITSPDQITETYDTLTFNEARRIMKLFGKKHYKFEFNEDKFTEGDSVPIFCSSCQQEGHIREDCEDEKLPELKPLGDISAQHIALLSDILINLREEMEPSQEEMKLRGEVVLNLQQQIRKEKYSGALLHLFGSSANGFGFANSDLDVCITFEENKHREQIDQNFLIFDLAQILRRSRQFVDVLPIATAKVPIVKFRCGKTSLEGDLSLYNTLALHNTKLLWTYSVIDPRVKVLGYGLKYFAKRCDIGDASRGSLSSYAFTLLLIHFLQQVQPPVVPVLQKLYNKDNPPTEVQVEGWNAWFYSDLKNMYKAWPGYRKNKKSVGELWIEMFCYYTEKFNFDDNVVTIRQEEPLLRLEKLWNNRSIAIEDPFDLNHNLGGALSRKMNTFIMKAFINGRHMYGGLNKLPIELDKAVEFLFDPKQLTAGAPPNDRGCRRCRRIGHMVKDCPQRKDPNETPKNKKKEQQSNQAAQPQNSGKGQNKQEKPTGMSAKEQRLALSGSAPTKKKDDKALLGEKGMQKIKENLPQGTKEEEIEFSQLETTLKEMFAGTQNRIDILVQGYRIYNIEWFLTVEWVEPFTLLLSDIMFEEKEPLVFLKMSKRFYGRPEDDYVKQLLRHQAYFEEYLVDISLLDFSFEKSPTTGIFLKGLTDMENQRKQILEKKQKDKKERKRQRKEEEKKRRESSVKEEPKSDSVKNKLSATSRASQETAMPPQKSLNDKVSQNSSAGVTTQVKIKKNEKKNLKGNQNSADKSIASSSSAKQSKDNVEYVASGADVKTKSQRNSKKKKNVMSQNEAEGPIPNAATEHKVQAPQQNIKGKVKVDVQSSAVESAMRSEGTSVRPKEKKPQKKKEPKVKQKPEAAAHISEVRRDITIAPTDVGQTNITNVLTSAPRPSAPKSNNSANWSSLTTRKSAASSSLFAMGAKATKQTLTNENKGIGSYIVVGGEEAKPGAASNAKSSARRTPCSSKLSVELREVVEISAE
uniref:Terminal uridylyltransferase 4-like isoform X1 n=1 Tax=Hirondellea gigas TaxID=1518452 RepID=A0A6A7FM67_9CRUS